MWFLTSENDEKNIYITPEKKEVTIGRSPDQSICDFAIQDDPSISRKHAVLIYNDKSLYVKDLGSRYGTFVNTTEKVESTNYQLKNNDIIKFGKMNSVWTVHEAGFVTCTSTLKGENLVNLKSLLSRIGGLLKNDWDDSCQYLTMPAITLTIKVVLALVQGSHIVNTQFWNDCHNAIINKEPLPDPKNYTPEILETTLNKDVVSFLPINQRRVLFAGIKFIFFSKRQHDMYKPVLLKGSANPQLLSESTFTKSMLAEDDVVVIQYNITTSQETQAQKNQINEIITYLKTKGKRVIADAEIGLAILYVSTSKYCNPSFNFTSEVIKQAPVQQSNTVLAQETQDQVGSSHNKDNVIINESLVSNNDSNSSKRKLSDIHDEDMESNANKKIASDINKTSTDSLKRKLDDGDQDRSCKKVAGDSNSGSDLFNFITPVSKDINKNSTADKGNVNKSLKRKAGFEPSDDNLFNFIENEDENNDPSQSVFDEAAGHNAKKPKTENLTEDISALRGSKLEELNNDKNWNSNILKPNNIKKEIEDDIDMRMNKLDIGSVVIVIKDNLIVKKEPIEIESRENVRNFKKFKKVWPIRMQVTVIPKSSMSIVMTNDNNSEMSSLDNNTE